MPWWAWMLVGIALLAAELLTPGGFYVLFFGLAALVVGALGVAGIALHPALQWLLFAALSIVALLLLRQPLLARLQIRSPKARVDDLSGETAVPVEAIAPGAVGRAELRGTVWTARNSGPVALAAGERCRVVRAEGLTLLLEPES
ncbi:MAG: NfeD family protein [Thermoanaerobaculia bacterium]|nr:MAG: NfeD family protein [Thermoanaerobaculia bacterium]